MQRRKGANAERELCRLLSDHLGDDVIRNLSQSRDGGHDLLGVGRFALEVKRCEKLSLFRWWMQAYDQAQDAGLWPALAYRQSRQPWRFAVPVEVVLRAHDPHLWEPATMGIYGFAMVVREVGLL